MAWINRFDVKGKEHMIVRGVDYGGSLEILKENETHILCKKPGSMQWVAIGTWEYAYPEFLIFEKKGDSGEVKECLGESFEYRRETKKEVRAKVFEAFERKVGVL